MLLFFLLWMSNAVGFAICYTPTKCLTIMDVRRKSSRSYSDHAVWCPFSKMSDTDDDEMTVEWGDLRLSNWFLNFGLLNIRGHDALTRTMPVVTGHLCWHFKPLIGVRSHVFLVLFLQMCLIRCFSQCSPINCLHACYDKISGRLCFGNESNVFIQMEWFLGLILVVRGLSA